MFEHLNFIVNFHVTDYSDLNIPAKDREILSELGKNVAEINSNGLVMHSSLALTTEGLPLGLLHQKIFPRISRTPEQKKLQDKTKRTQRLQLI